MMNFIRKLLCNVLIFPGLLANQVKASNVRDEQGRIILVNFLQDINDSYNMQYCYNFIN
jgi:hypothetical protein